MRERWWVRPLILLAVVVAGVAVALTVDLPTVDAVRADVAAAGWAGPVLYAGVYTALSLTPAPTTVLSVGAGVLFGLATGLTVVMAGALAGAVAGFGLARVLGRAAVERVDSRRLRALDALLRRRGLLAVIGTRLVPLLPFTTLNYAYGLSAVRFRDYVLGTAVGILPGATAYVTIGAYGATPGSVPFLLAVGGLAVLAVAGALVARRRRRATAGAEN
ncbi:TVP38/TMEM64 family protein [Pseudonocardia nigra]|uniref:TVP38/TMEM64 family protein n=1 Tax=Pseudonocardia nigra TaxID=1921578 RepID=UPI001C5EEAF7|nr:VTT domain-containing protein [Pseudonocardia nigra]